MERWEAKECEADREMKGERTHRVKEAGPEAIRKGKYPDPYLTLTNLPLQDHI